MGASRLYRAGTPFNADDLRALDYAQAADVMYFAHLNYSPRKSTRADHTDWTFAEVDFGPTGSPPTGVGVAATTPNTDNLNPDGSAKSNSQYYPRSKTYAVASVGADGQISRLSNTASVSNDLSLKGNYNTVTWTADPDAEYYLVFAHDNNSQSFGYLGRSETTTFQDNDGGIAPDYSDGPRIGEDPFDALGNYPSSVAFHQQRLMWARTLNKPNGVFGSQSSDFENMDRSRPTKDDDALSFALVSERVNAVQQLVSMRSLLALTSDGIFSINGGSEGSALTASQIVSDRQTGRGVSRLKPVAVDNTLFFKPNQGSSIRTLGYTFEVDGFRSNDITIFSPHFFDGFGVVAWAFQGEPYSALWVVRDDGKLLCLTWEQEQQVWGWTLCETSGSFEDVCTITEGGVDRVYVAVRRTLNGQEDVFIERLALPLLVADRLDDSCYLDCAVTQAFDPPSAEIAMLHHLEGEEVTVFADGYVITGKTVQDGKVTLDFACSKATVGLPYSGEIETLPLSLNTDSGSLQGSRQMIDDVIVRVEKTRGLKVGAGGGELFELKQRENENADEPITLKTGDFNVKLQAKWSDEATVRVVQDYPLPATINALFLKPRVTK